MFAIFSCERSSNMISHWRLKIYPLFFSICLLLPLLPACNSFQSQATTYLLSCPLASCGRRLSPYKVSCESLVKKSKLSILSQKCDSLEPERPDWALNWMPTWLITLRPIYQLIITVSLFFFHLKVLTQHSIAFPFQLIPNNFGYFQSIGLDSIAGIISLAGYLWLRRATKQNSNQAVPSLIDAPKRFEAPWRFSKADPRPKSTSFLASIVLLGVYSYTGRFSYFWEDFLYSMAGSGFQMTVPMHRALTVLLGHLSWVVCGGLILHLIPRPQPFFGGGQATEETSIEDAKQMNKDSRAKQKNNLNPIRWFTSKWNTYWLWWTLGGYFVSSWFYNLADFCNQIFMPHYVFESSPESVVALLINPEHNDWLASFVGCLAPCLTAPWWEEILYRGFLLPALCLYMPYGIALWISGLIFSLHHLSAVGAIPLLVLGCTWGALYTKCGNLLVTILIHCMWNSRVFIGNWLGL